MADAGTRSPSVGQKEHGRRGRVPVCRVLFAWSDGASERSERASPPSSISSAYSCSSGLGTICTDICRSLDCLYRYSIILNKSLSLKRLNNSVSTALITVFRFQYRLPSQNWSIFSIVSGSKRTDINFKFSILRIVLCFYLKVAIIASKAVAKAYNAVFADIVKGTYLAIEPLRIVRH